MIKLFTGVFIIALALHFANSVGQDDNTTVIDEDLPLVLIRKKDGNLVIPTDVKLKPKWPWEENIIEFSSPPYNKQIFYCPAETDDQWNKIEKANKIYDRNPSRLGDRINQNCLFRKNKIEKTDRFPKCENPLEPQTMTVLGENQTAATNRNNEASDNAVKLATCGPSDAGLSLLFGYQICDEYEWISKLLYPISDKTEVYPFRVGEIQLLEICYDVEKMDILYISHTIMVPHLWKNNLLEKEVLKKPSEEIRTNKLNHIEMDFERIKMSLEKIDASETVPFKIQLLAPLEDFPLLSWKTPAYHYVNASLMHTDLQSNWDLIHDIIKQNSDQTKTYFTIHTRVLKISDTPAPIKEIEDNYDIQIPSIWVQLVYYRIEGGEKKALTIFANNYRDENVENFIAQEYGCARNLCRNIRTFEKVDVDMNNFRCCQVTKNIQELFGLDLISYDVLDIPNFSEDENSPRDETSPSHPQNSQSS